MVEITINYEGELRCRNTHGPSGTDLSTDAPVDNNGRGESFSPTDLIATALGSCMATIMGITAKSRGLEIEGLVVNVKKHMSTDMPRRITKLEVNIVVPLADDHPSRKLLEAAALTCPVHESIHPDIEVSIDWIWVGH